MKTCFHHLEIKHAEVDKPKAIVKREKLNVIVPLTIDIKNLKVQLEIRNGIERAWRKEAKEYLPKRVEELASKHKFSYKKV